MRKEEEDELRAKLREFWERDTDDEDEGSLTKEEALTKVIQTISTTATCCHEALHDYWDRSDEGFQCMQRELERALRLLGQPLPDYAAVDAQWDESNGEGDEEEGE